MLTLAHTETHPGITYIPHTNTHASESKSEIVFDPSVLMEEDFKEEKGKDGVNLPDMSNPEFGIWLSSENF